MVTDADLAALELMQGDSGVSVLHKERLRLDPGVIHGGKLIKLSKFQEVLRRLFHEKSKFQSGKVNLILPERLHTHHVANITSKSETGQVAKRLESAFFPEGKGHWQYSVNKHENGKRSHICLRGIPKKDLRRYEELFSDFGLPIESVISPSDAGLSFYYDQGVTAEPGIWLWVGPHQSEIALYGVHSTIASETLPFGILDLENQLKRELRVSRAKADFLLRHIGARSIRHETGQQIQALVTQWMRPFFSETKSFADLARSVHQLHPSLILCGVGASIPHFSELLSKYAGLESRSHRSYLPINGGLSMKEYYDWAPLIGGGLYKSFQ